MAYRKQRGRKDNHDDFFSYFEGHLVIRVLAMKVWEDGCIPPSTMTSTPGLKVSGITPRYLTGRVLEVSSLSTRIKDMAMESVERSSPCSATLPNSLA